MAEELNEALLEGIHVDKWQPGTWANPVGEDDEWQPELDSPHINDYAAFKKHKHYGKYFRQYRYQPFPAWMYHKTLEPKIVKSREEVQALGPEWSPTPPNVKRIDMTGKSLPVKSETQRLAEVVAQALAVKAPASGGVDANAIAATVAAVMAALGQKPVEAPIAPASDGELFAGADGEAAPEADIERAAMIELADKNNVKIDKRWSNDRIKKELGL
jgi:hypothetical protein